ncbi:hypothetical protein [Frondihabitans sucicola]|uniref:hypothetical protein n=1 Tax=Frondihabitans sucicola TaxID=1268041 RepID=UPI002573A504|nr:hypothetical protein [Frondihabitans sucicola]
MNVFQPVTDSADDPTFGQGLGTTLGFVDQLAGDPKTKAAVAHSRVRIGERDVRRVGDDILSRTLSGSASADAGEIVSRYGGFIVFEAGVYALHAQLVKLARATDANVDKVIDDFFAAQA